MLNRAASCNSRTLDPIEIKRPGHPIRANQACQTGDAGLGAANLPDIAGSGDLSRYTVEFRAKNAYQLTQCSIRQMNPLKKTGPPPDNWKTLPTDQRLEAIGHRAYIGGNTPDVWFGIGRLQYQFLVSQGLEPTHDFLDIACGSLRLGQFLIPFLESGRYFGLDVEPGLIEAGLTKELLFDLARMKKPVFNCNSGFDFGFVRRYDYAMAQSLFTHLNKQDIALCFRNLRLIAPPGSRFYFTFKPGDATANPERPSHAHESWKYQFQDFLGIADPKDWALTLIGDWGHPRGQQIAWATPR